MDGYTEIVVIMDRSSSMQPIRDDTIGGFNTFLENQRCVTGEARFTLVLFDLNASLLQYRIPTPDAKPLQC